MSISPYIWQIIIHHLQDFYNSNFVPYISKADTVLATKIIFIKSLAIDNFVYKIWTK